MYAYFNNGLSFRSVAANYAPGPGEVVFADIASQTQLVAAFPGYASALASVSGAALSAQAQQALDKSDITVLRCFEKGVALPSAWVAYRASLRAAVTAGAQAPQPPKNPDGSIAYPA